MALPSPAMGLQTRGQASATEAVRRMIAGQVPHAVLLVGPASSGKTTLALDLATGLLCTDPDPVCRPCGHCRGCRQVASGNHPDLHRLAPEGAGREIRIGPARELVSHLSRLPVEGGARVAVIEAAHRMNEDAQNAVLKTLEEPPSGVTIVLCADDEDRLLPTVRSRCARLRLGPVATRDIEDLLAERCDVEPPTAARLARLAWGRPGLAMAYAGTPDAAAIRDEMSRQLLDLLSANRSTRLAAARDLLARAADLIRVASGSGTDEPAGDDAAVGDDESELSGEAEARSGGPRRGGRSAAKASPAERRQAAQLLLDEWRGVARDLAVVEAGGRREIRDPALLEELEHAADAIPAHSAAAFLERLAAVEDLLAQNANPELAVDVLALRWPRAAAAPASQDQARKPAGRPTATAGIAAVDPANAS